MTDNKDLVVLRAESKTSPSHSLVYATATMDFNEQHRVEYRSYDHVVYSSNNVGTMQRPLRRRGNMYELSLAVNISQLLSLLQESKPDSRGARAVTLRETLYHTQAMPPYGAFFRGVSPETHEKFVRLLLAPRFKSEWQGTRVLAIDPIRDAGSLVALTELFDLDWKIPTHYASERSSTTLRANTVSLLGPPGYTGPSNVLLATRIDSVGPVVSYSTMRGVVPTSPGPAQAAKLGLSIGKNTSSTPLIKHVLRVVDRADQDVLVPSNSAPPKILAHTVYGNEVEYWPMCLVLKMCC